MISIIVVSYNGRQFISKLINSICSQSYRDIELVIIDNRSKRDNMDLYMDNLFQTKYIRNSENRGFAYAVNMAMAYAQGEYIVLLNNDIYIGDEFLNTALEAMKKHSRSFIAPVVYTYDGRAIDSAGDTINREYKPCKIKQIKRRDSMYAVDGISMSACFFRKKDFLDAGCLKDYFFLYFEDAEFALRAGRMGYQFLVEPHADAYHYVSAATRMVTGSEYSSMKTFYESRNRILMMRSENGKNIIMNLPFIIKGTMASIMFHMLKTHYCIDYIAGLFAGIRGLGRV